MHVVANPTSLIASKERLTDILMDLIYPIADNQSSTLLRPPPAPQQVLSRRGFAGRKHGTHGGVSCIQPYLNKAYGFMFNSDMAASSSTILFHLFEWATVKYD